MNMPPQFLETLHLQYICQVITVYILNLNSALSQFYLSKTEKTHPIAIRAEKEESQQPQGEQRRGLGVTTPGFLQDKKSQSRGEEWGVTGGTTSHPVTSHQSLRLAPSFRQSMGPGASVNQEGGG